MFFEQFTIQNEKVRISEKRVQISKINFCRQNHSYCQLFHAMFLLKIFQFPPFKTFYFQKNFGSALTYSLLSVLRNLSVQTTGRLCILWIFCEIKSHLSEIKVSVGKLFQE